MVPVVFRIPLLNWDVPGYGLMLTIGFLLSVIWAARRASRSGANPDTVLNCAFVALIAGVAGARLMYVIHYWDQFAYRGNFLQILFATLDVRKGGLEVYGGFIAATVSISAYLIFWRHSLRWYLDILAPSTALGMGIGRLGCFLNGCCWGVPAELPWAVRFPFGSNAMVEQWYAGLPGLEVPKELIAFPANGIGPDGRAAYLLLRDILWTTEEQVARDLAAVDRLKAEAEALKNELARAQTDPEKKQVEARLAHLRRRTAGAIPHADIVEALQTHGISFRELRQLARQYYSAPVHPTQLYSAAGLILLALLLNALYWRRTRDGQVVATMLLIEPWSRFVLEMIRADNPVDVLSLTISQFLALSLSLVGLAGLILVRFLPPRSRRARVWAPPQAS